MSPESPRPSAPLSDAIIVALAKLVDDAQSETREPSHSDIDFLVQQASLKAGDPKVQGMLVGKAKRVRATLSWALENNVAGGEKLVAALAAHVRGCGGFRDGSPNFVGSEPIRNLADAFKSEGFLLSETGELSALVLENLSGEALSDALMAYVRRAKKGVADAALVAGTAKDLLEAVAAHILVERYGVYPTHSNFPTLLGQAYAALGLPTPQSLPVAGEPAQARLARALFDSACAVNGLRNKEGTGHGRPWLSTVSNAEARSAVELMGVIGEYLLNVHKAHP